MSAVYIVLGHDTELVGTWPTGVFKKREKAEQHAQMLRDLRKKRGEDNYLYTVAMDTFTV